MSIDLPPEPPLVRQHPHLASALARGVLTKEQIQEALKVVHALKKAGATKTPDEVLVRKGYITPDQLKELHRESRPSGAPGTFGDYEIFAKIGGGGMGTVFRARQISKDRMVALKILHSGLSRDKVLRTRFEREARAMIKLDHPHIVAGYEAGHLAGRYYLAMEYIDGEALDARLRRTGASLPESEAVEIARQIAEALDHAHNHNILHRDVKPENIMIDRQGQTRLMDLGLARAIAVSTNNRLTREGMAVGTPHYMSPEQVQALDEIGPASDLYALGAVLYECLTGEPPYDAPDLTSLLLRHINDPVPDPAERNPQLSAQVSAIVKRCLQKDPRDRYPTAAALADDLTLALRAPLHGQPVRLKTPLRQQAAGGGTSTEIRLVGAGLIRRPGDPRSVEERPPFKSKKKKS